MSSFGLISVQASFKLKCRALRQAPDLVIRAQSAANYAVLSESLKSYDLKQLIIYVTSGQSPGVTCVNAKPLLSLSSHGFKSQVTISVFATSRSISWCSGRAYHSPK